MAIATAPLWPGDGPPSSSVRSYVLQPGGQETHSVSAGLDYPDVGPEHSWLRH
jgi:tryptophan synthase beta subunit